MPHILRPHIFPHLRFAPPQQHGRLFWALCLSLAAHAVAIFPLRWSFSDTPLASQVFLQANLRPAAAIKPLANNNDMPRDRKVGEASRSSRSSAPNRIVSPHDARQTVATATPVQTTENVESVTDREAMATHQALPPEYPAEALRRNLEGCVLAAVTVAIDGGVSRVEILAADHPGIFDQSVVDAQIRAKYIPARRAGQAIETRVLAVAGFVLTSSRKLNCALKYAPMAEKLMEGRPQ